MRALKLWGVLIVTLAVSAVLQAAPVLSLVKSGTASTTSDAIVFGATATYSLDLRHNTDGNAVDALQLHISTSPANAVTYSATPATPLNNPWTAGDFSPPTAGATVNAAGPAITALFKLLPFNPPDDYAAYANNAIVTYQFNTSALPVGSYVFTPVGEGQAALQQPVITTFATPGTFTLTVNPIPEPASLGLLGLATAGLLLRRRA